MSDVIENNTGLRYALCRQYSWKSLKIGGVPCDAPPSISGSIGFLVLFSSVEELKKEFGEDAPYIAFEATKVGDQP